MKKTIYKKNCKQEKLYKKKLFMKKTIYNRDYKLKKLYTREKT